jgi:hypothetical protein
MYLENVTMKQQPIYSEQDISISLDDFRSLTPSILYFGTPVVLISMLNENGSVNLASMSSVPGRWAIQSYWVWVLRARQWRI